MRILITSGGTKVAIDPVRNIANKSTGRFGAALAKEALRHDAEVIYLTSHEGMSPFLLQIDCSKVEDQAKSINEVTTLYEFAQQFHKNYHEYRYQYYNEYAEVLKTLIKQFKPDVVMAAAAVSDYIVNSYSNEKIRSSHDLMIQLEIAPKIINQIKLWLPNVFLVGFKLLLDASDKELVNAAMKTIEHSQADIVIGNNLSSLEKGAHEVLIIEKNGTFVKVTKNLSEYIIKRVMQR